MALLAHIRCKKERGKLTVLEGSVDPDDSGPEDSFPEDVPEVWDPDEAVPDVEPFSQHE